MIRGTPAAVESVALLADPNRRRLYDLVVASGQPVGRDDAATSLGIGRELAAFHLDRLVAGGLLATEYRRRNGRTGPGAGRPAKLYRRADREIEVSLPHRSYARAAEVFARALSRLDGPSAVEGVAAVARELGTAVGTRARRDAGEAAGHHDLQASLLELLGTSGYEPDVAPGTHAVRLRNCPYRALAASHRELTCGMNLAWAEGVLDGLGDPELEAELAPTPGACCVVFNERDPRAGPPGP